MTKDEVYWAWWAVGLTLLSALPCLSRRGRRYPLGDQCILPLCCPPFPDLPLPVVGVVRGGEEDCVPFRGKGADVSGSGEEGGGQELGDGRGGKAGRRRGGIPAWRAVLDAALPRLAFGLLGGYLLAAVSTFIMLSNKYTIQNRFPALSASACVDECSPSDLYCCTYSEPGIPHQEVWLSSGGGKVHGWWIPAPNESTSLTLLYNHGSGSNIASVYRKQRYEFLRSLNLNVFAYDYPGYGKSEGVPSEEGCKRAAEDALQYVLRRTGQHSRQTLCLGRSMGTALATYLASKHEFKGVVLQSGFTALADYGSKAFPAVWWLIAWADPIGGWDSISNMRYIDTCLLQFHSRADEWVPFPQGKRLFDAAANVRPECKVWVEDDKALHDDPLTEQEKVAMARWVSLLR